MFSHTSLAIDARGNPHVSYFASDDLRYAVRTGGVWSIETADGGVVNVGFETSLALDTQGNPHIAYYDNNNQDLKYATKTGGTWFTETVDTPGNMGKWPSLAVDAAGNPHISYYDFTNFDLKYAVKSGGWSIEIVDATGDKGAHSSIDIDSHGNPHISYYDFGPYDLLYAFKTGGSWFYDTVDATDNVGYNSSLKLDSQGTPHVAYYDATNGDLKYAVKDAGAWTVQFADATGDVGQYVSLDLDASGNPHMSYYDVTNADLKYASRGQFAWTSETVDAPGDVGEWSSLELDAQGNPYISYLDDTNDVIRLTDSAIHLVSPAAGDTWPVGAERTVTWKGAGEVNIELSTDGGATYETLADSVTGTNGQTGGRHTLVVPHQPSKFCRLKIARHTPFSIAYTESLFTIETDVALLAFTISLGPGGGRLVGWATDPGPADLAGYRLERHRASMGWHTLAALTKSTSYEDGDGREGDRYRLYAINGLGDAYYLGEASGDGAPALDTAQLDAWPLPYRGGELHIRFATASGLGGAPTRSEVAIYDITGRLVRRVTADDYAAGVYTTTWDGRNAAGEPVATGVYLIRSVSGGAKQSRKIVVVR